MIDRDLYFTAPDGDAVTRVDYTNNAVYMRNLDALPGDLEAVVTVIEQFAGGPEGLEVNLNSSRLPSPHYCLGENKQHGGTLRFPVRDLYPGKQFSFAIPRAHCQAFLTLGLCPYPSSREFTHGKVLAYVRQR